MRWLKALVGRLRRPKPVRSCLGCNACHKQRGVYFCGWPHIWTPLPEWFLPIRYYKIGAIRVDPSVGAKCEAWAWAGRYDRQDNPNTPEEMRRAIKEQRGA